LDKVLRMARWPEPAADSLSRLRRQIARWQSQRAADPQPQRKQRRMAWAVAGSVAVAALLMALTLVSLRLLGDRSSVDVPANVARDLPPEVPSPAATAADRDARPTDARETSPEATILQDTLTAANPPVLTRPLPPGERYQRMFRARRWPRAAESTDPIDRIVAQRAADPDGDLQQLVEPLLDDRAESERRLLERFHTFAGERATAAIELLGCVGSEASLPLLQQLSCRPPTHAPALRVLLKIADPRLLARLALNESDPELREEITAALRARGDKQTLVFVLADQGEYSCLRSGSDWWPPVE
jgi:hypothetical protein